MVSFCAAAVHRGPKPLKLVYPAYFGNRINVPVDNATTEEGVALGRMLFYETALSANGKISCGTCHQKLFAFTDGQRFNTGVDGQPMTRNTMSLTNLLWVRNLFWAGRPPPASRWVKAASGCQHCATLPSPHRICMTAVSRPWKRWLNIITADCGHHQCQVYSCVIIPMKPAQRTSI